MSDNSLVVDLLDDDGDVRTRIDFAALSLHANVAQSLRDAFINEFSHHSLESGRQTWRAIRKLSICIHDLGLAEATVLPNDTLVQLQKWLASQPALRGSTCQSIFNICQIALQWCERNTGVFGRKALKIPSVRFKREQPQPTEALPEDIVRSVLKCCYAEIDDIKSRIATGRRLLKGTWENETERQIGILLQELTHLGNGLIAKLKIVNSSGNNLSRRVVDAGGLDLLSRKLFPSPEDVFPFYLAILIQTAGNPSSILELKRDSVRPHPVREDREMLVWVKRRSHAEQKADFSSSRSRSAPSLIKQLEELTEPLLPHAEEKQRKFLFIAKSKFGIRVPCVQLLHMMLSDFIAKHELPGFTFKQFRKTSAVLHEETSGNVLVAKRKLNHRSVRTTIAYVETSAGIEKGNELIARFQGELYELSKVGDALKLDNRHKLKSEKKCSSIFGFDCHDPFSGIAPQSEKGELCENFQHCAICFGALVVIDDPVIIAKLLKSMKVLREAEVRSSVAGWVERFDAVYRPTMEIIERDLLSKVSPIILEKAKKLPAPDIPFLE